MELFLQAPLLVRILRQIKTKISYGHVTQIPRDDGLPSEVNGNDPCCKIVGLNKFSRSRVGLRTHREPEEKLTTCYIGRILTNCVVNNSQNKYNERAMMALYRSTG